MELKRIDVEEVEVHSVAKASNFYKLYYSLPDEIPQPSWYILVLDRERFFFNDYNSAKQWLESALSNVG